MYICIHKKIYTSVCTFDGVSIKGYIYIYIYIYIYTMCLQ